MDTTPSYGMSARLPLSFGEARQRVEAALKEEGFGVLTEIDVQATLKQKLDVDFRPYVILGACNPHLAHQALELEPGVGLLLPCNVTLSQEDGGTLVSIVDAVALLTIGDAEGLRPIAQEAGARLARVLARLTQEG